MLKSWEFYEQHSLKISDPLVAEKRATLHRMLPGLYVDILSLVAAIYKQIEGSWYNKARMQICSP